MSILMLRERGGWLIAGFDAEYLTDPQIVARASGELADALARLPLRGRAVISFEGVVQASSQVASLLRSARALVVDERFGRLVLCRVGDRVGELLRLTGLERSFETFPRLRDVLAESGRATRTMVGAHAEASGRATTSNETEWID